jgi:single-strand DNA-binding protein
MNSITVSGNATRDPEIKFVSNGQAQLRIGLAVNRRWQNRQTQEWEEQVSFFDVVCYGKLAENTSNSITKGTRLVVTGRLEQRSWDTPEGVKKTVVELVADDIGASFNNATAHVLRAETKPAMKQAVAAYEEAF